MATTKRTLDGHGEENWLYRPHFPEHWGRSDLYSLAKWVNGLAFRNIEFQPKGMPVIKITEIKNGITEQTKFTLQEFDESVRVSPGDMLFSWSGQPESSIDVSRWLGPEGWLNQHIFRVTVDPGVEEDFFYYLLKYLNPNFVSIARNKQTTGLGHVTKKDLEQIEVALPVPSEQQAIAHILGTLDDKIELNRRMNRTLDEMARAIFQDWFVDFGPTRAKMEGLDPYLPPELWDLFPEELVDSELGEIPEGWGMKPLSEFASLNPESWSKTNFPDEIEYVDLANTKWGTIESTLLIAWKSAPSRARRILKTGDTVVGTVRPGNGSYSFVGRDGLTGSTGFAVLRPLSQHSRELVYLAATDPTNIDRLTNRADGAAYPAVRPEVVGETIVVTPIEGISLLDCFSKVASPQLDMIEKNQAEDRTLVGLREELLPSLLSGKPNLGYFQQDD